MTKPAMVNANQVTSLIKELLILNRMESALADLPPTPEQLEQWQCKRKRIRQELVQALSLHKFQREMLVMQNHIE
ncbi:MAG: hypothetical protein DMG82_07955 [Acidobacteria bacterium]|nr:MAG: hypothetical protein DMG82_07955 [Acidobacteriota bacterium]PYX44079.1 MAG: hypothetical protein DMG83_15065 [Acidobacteriota bacterium]